MSHVWGARGSLKGSSCPGLHSHLPPGPWRIGPRSHSAPALPARGWAGDHSIPGGDRMSSKWDGNVTDGQGRGETKA